jgi:hypothetical protein
MAGRPGNDPPSPPWSHEMDSTNNALRVPVAAGLAMAGRSRGASKAMTSATRNYADL